MRMTAFKYCCMQREQQKKTIHNPTKYLIKYIMKQFASDDNFIYYDDSLVVIVVAWSL